MRRFNEARTSIKIATSTFLWLLAIYMLVSLIVR
jgi:hypothetical protein